METSTKTPRHVAIILDGNRRWAKENGLSGIEGHKKSAANFEGLLAAGKELGIKVMTFWAFSTENWNRTKEEVDLILDLLSKLLDENGQKFIDEKIRFIHIGRSDRMPKEIMDKISRLVDQTKDFTDYTIVLALDYGGHDELVRAFRKMQLAGLEVTEENIEKSLDTFEVPRVDLIIRTGGDVRLSGFMSWQSEYAELYFTDTALPDFNEDELKKAVEEFSKRERRFGGN